MATRRRFSSSMAAIAWHKKNIIDAQKKIVPILAKEFVKDAHESGFVPEDTRALKSSAENGSDWDNGIIIWDTDYARRRYYEGSVTGVAYWSEVTQGTYALKYKRMIITELKRRT